MIKFIFVLILIISLISSISIISDCEIIEATRTLPIGYINSPIYNSDWISINQNEFKTLNHNVGGNSNNYVVMIEAKNPDTLVHNLYYGFTKDTISGSSTERGFYYLHLNITSITIYRAKDDVRANEIRVRIWIYD